MNNPLPFRVMLRDPLFRGAAAALVLAVVVLSASTVGAVRLDAVSAAAPAPTVADSALRFPPVAGRADIPAAVAQDLFADDRQAPARRYLMPGESDVAAAPAPRPVVLGTAVSSDGSDFAVCGLGDGSSRIVYIGGAIGRYTVVAIARGAVTFRGPDGERFTIDAGKP